MKTVRAVNPDLATERLAGELADVEASIALISSGVASSITLTGLVFGQQVAEQLKATAKRRGVHLEATFWPEDAIGDIHLSRIEEPDRG